MWDYARRLAALALGRDSVKGTGDRTQRPLAGGISEGFRVDGTRSWTGATGTWVLSIEGVEMRWADPVPQAGTYSLGTPYDKSVSMTFERVDADTISVTVAGPKHEFSFDVSKTGDIAAH